MTSNAVELEELRQEVANLRRWKTEAIAVLGEWDKVTALVERVAPCPLGHSRARHAQRFVAAAIRRSG